MEKQITELKCPVCKAVGLKIVHNQTPEGILLGWNKNHTEYIEGVEVTDAECSKCGWSDSDVSIFD